VVAVTVLLPAGARIAARSYHDDTLWANALAVLGGSTEPFDLAIFLEAGDDVAAGRNPYPDPASFREDGQQSPYAYPPVLALAVVPLAALPQRVGEVAVPGLLFSLLLVGATVGALLLLDVRDWRCYPVALLYPPTLENVEYGAVGPLLLLAGAAAWRWRDRAARAGAAAGLVVVLKLFLWPLVLWLAFTRRPRAAATAVASAAGLAALAWAAIGFRGLADYPGLLRELAEQEAASSYSALALLRTAGLPGPLAQALVLGAGVALLVLARRAARAPEGDRHALTLVLAAALVLTPILWLHYLVLLLLPIALARPRLSALWLVPLSLTAFEALDWYRGWPRGDGEALASVALVVALVLVLALRPRVGGEVRAEPAGA
jgi:hypothetical protein